MLSFILRRAGTLLITLVALSILVFLLSEVFPIDPTLRILGRESTPEARAALAERMGLNRPLPERYIGWLTRFISGDWGESYRLGADILPLVQRHLVNSIILAVAALLIIVPLALTLGVISGLNEGRWSDRAISVGSLVTISLPDFVVGILLILVFSWWLRLLPADSSLRGAHIDLAQHWRKLVLPALTAAFVLTGYIARVTRVSVIEVMDSQYVRTAVLKGLPRRKVITRHVLRNALIAPIAVITTQIAWLIGGLIVIESLFNYPGMGSLFSGAAGANDLPMIAASSMTTMVIVVFSQLIADLLYAFLNPRIRFT